MKRYTFTNNNTGLKIHMDANTNACMKIQNNIFADTNTNTTNKKSFYQY